MRAMANSPTKLMPRVTRKAARRGEEHRVVRPPKRPRPARRRWSRTLCAPIRRIGRKMAALPDAMSTIMVSPNARPRPSAMLAAMPGAAAGMTAHDGLPAGRASARKPRRSCAGRRPTLPANGEDDGDDGERKGHAGHQGVEPGIETKRLLKPGGHHHQGEEPSTTEGTQRGIDGGLDSLARRRPAYCETKTAAPTPSGTATNMAMTVTFMVPTTNGQPHTSGSRKPAATRARALVPRPLLGEPHLASVTSLAMAALWKSGHASSPWKTKMRMTAAMELKSEDPNRRLGQCVQAGTPTG